MNTQNNLQDTRSDVGEMQMSAPTAMTNDMSEVKPLPVASTIRRLAKGQSAVFPIEQRSTVMNTISRFRMDYARSAWNAIVQTNRQEFSVIVTRVN